MTSERVCPQCEKPLASDAPQGLCPECLLKAAFPSEAAHESAATGYFNSTPAITIPPDAGTRLRYFGDYELLEEIAQGGMGVVWKARQSSLNRHVALKMIRAGALASPDEVARFLREAEAAANLQHANIVAIHEVGEHEGRHYFSMDLVNGRDLGAVVKEGPLSPQRAARYVKIVADAIHFAHQRGTLHRDLKPQNILIDTADQPRITDFGLAKIMTHDSQMTQSGVIMGSPSYMPPEQAAGRHSDIGPASDVYSLGAMLYELLTGQPPFRGATAMATLRNVLETEPAALRRLKADIPPDLETICLKCLEKSPTARYPTARALAEELDRFLIGEPIQARRASAVRKAVSWGRRHQGALAAMAALVIVALAYGVFYLWEESAFLRAKLANPALERVQGPLQAALQVWVPISIIVSLAGWFANIVVNGWARGLSLRARKWFSAEQRSRPLQPLDDRSRYFAICAGLILCGRGVVFLVTAIKAKIWEGYSIWNVIWLGEEISFFLIWGGAEIFGKLIRDYRLVHYGPSATPGPQLTSEQYAALEKVGAAMVKWDERGARKIYREAMPNSRPGEAAIYVFRLGKAMRAEYPAMFAYPPLSLSNLSWKGMLICAAFEAAVFALVWNSNPPSQPIPVILPFAYSFLFGAGTQAFWRANGIWKRLLLLTPTLMSVVAGEAMLRSAVGPWRIACSVLFCAGAIAFTRVKRPWKRMLLLVPALYVIIVLSEAMDIFELYLCGYCFGVLLMFSGLAGEAGRALRKKLSSTN
jgi:tRNA A-37 threonylcarbamoyl transferase component Bud32